MNKFLRWYYKNKVKFWKLVLVVIGIYLLILLLNNFSGKSISEEKNENKNITNTITYANKDSIKSEETIIGTQTEKQYIKNANEIIDKFIKYCNNEEVDKAYELISDNCKEEIFPTIQDFINLYYNNIFNITKTYKMQNWSGNTYKIEYRDSLLATGGIETEEFIRDYITIEKNGDSAKLNINNYIGRTHINKTETSGDVKFKVVSKDVYMDYEIYNFEIENNSRNDILMDNLEYSTSIFLKDEYNKKHYAHSAELTEGLLIVRPKQNKNISIKFTNSYIVGRKISSINFSKFIRNINEKESLAEITIEL